MVDQQLVDWIIAGTIASLAVMSLFAIAFFKWFMPWWMRYASRMADRTLREWRNRR